MIAIDSLSHIDLLRTIKLSTESKFQASQKELLIVFSIYCGVMVAMLVYNVVIYLVLRNTFQVYYCLSLILMLIYGFNWFGLAPHYLEAVTPATSVSVGYIVSSAAAMVNILFLLAFLGRSYVNKGIKTALLYSGALQFILACCASVKSTWSIQLDLLFHASLGLVILLAIAIIVHAIRQGSRSAWLYTLAWAPTLTFVLAINSQSLGITAYNHNSDVLLFIAVAMETILLSVAMADRILQLKQQRDLATFKQAEFKKLANIDPLTGLLNRRGLTSHYDVNHKSQPTKSVSIILFDIDNFKKINDKYGHKAGDNILQAITNTAKNICRDNDILARIGGEEFLIFSPGLSPQSALNIAERIRLSISSLDEKQRHPIIERVTASFGVATGTLQEPEIDNLYSKADQAMYSAKELGRNRAIEFTEELAVKA